MAEGSHSLGEGWISFFDESTLFASAERAVSSGVQTFYNRSVLHTGMEGTSVPWPTNTISGGQQNFLNNSALNANVTSSIIGGQQSFYDSSSLNANTSLAINGGKINLSNYAQLQVRAEDALTRQSRIDFFTIRPPRIRVWAA